MNIKIEQRSLALGLANPSQAVPLTRTFAVAGRRMTLFGYGVSSALQVFFSVLMKKNRRAPTRWLTVFAASFRSRNR